MFEILMPQIILFEMLDLAKPQFTMKGQRQTK